MKRYASRHQAHSLNELNVTPLLDLAFVLLIIFVIATQTIEHSVDLSLPEGGDSQENLKPEIVKTVEIAPGGGLAYESKKVDIGELETQLVSDYKANTNIVVFLRVDKDAAYKSFFEVTDMCTRNGIVRFSLRAEPDEE